MTRRPTSARDAAEAAFKSATAKAPERVREQSKAPGSKETVSLRVDSAVVEAYQAEGPGWQDRMAEAIARGLQGR